jgi:TolB-like protein/lipoprotein NlpI
MPPFLQRLRERKIVQWAVAYLAGAWAIMEVAGYVGDQFSWPAVVGQVITVLAVVGFFLTLVLAWYHGEKGRQRVSGPELLMVAALLLIAAVAVSLIPGSEEGATSSAPFRAPAGNGRPAIAVLSCENFSPDPTDASFANGMHDEILVRLSKISGLSTIGRETVEWYRDHPRPMREMVAELGVGFIGECSVRKDQSQNQIRVTFQLIDGNTGSQIWAENYDRSLTASSIFAIHSDVAQQVARAVGAVLTPEEQARIGTRPTESLDAYTANSIGRVWLSRRGTQGSEALEQAIARFEEALQHDSAFAPAYAGLATAYLLSPFYGEFVPGDVAYQRAADAVQAALRLNPDLAEAHTALAFLNINYEWEWQAGERGYRRAIELDPGFATTYQWFGFYFITMRRFDDAQESMRTALRIEPLSPIINEDYGDAYYYDRDYERAIEQYERTLALFPARQSTHIMLGLALLQLQRYEEAREQLLLGLGDTEGPPQLPGAGALSVVYSRLGDSDAAQEIVDRSAGGTIQMRLFSYAGTEDVDGAFEMIDLAVDQRAPWLWRVTVDPLFDFLRSDSRYDDLLSKMGLD